MVVYPPLYIFISFTTFSFLLFSSVKDRSSDGEARKQQTNGVTLVQCSIIGASITRQDEDKKKKNRGAEMKTQRRIHVVAPCMSAP